MSDQRTALAQQKGVILQRIADQRTQLHKLSATWQPPLSLIEQGINAIRTLRRHPALTAGAISFILIRRKRVWETIRTGIKLWGGFRSLRALAERFATK